MTCPDCEKIKKERDYWYAKAVEWRHNAKTYKKQLVTAGDIDMSNTKSMAFCMAEYVTIRLAGSTMKTIRNGQRRRPRPATEAKAQSERGVESSVAGSGE